MVGLHGAMLCCSMCTAMPRCNMFAAAATSVVTFAAVAAVDAGVNALPLLLALCVFCLQGLVRLRARYGFLLVVDEAHATLVTGQHGGGAAEAMGVVDSVDVHTGGLSTGKQVCRMPRKCGHVACLCHSCS
jgi:hypothetical protein